MDANEVFNRAHFKMLNLEGVFGRGKVEEIVASLCPADWTKAKISKIASELLDANLDNENVKFVVVENENGNKGVLYKSTFSSDNVEFIDLGNGRIFSLDNVDSIDLGNGWTFHKSTLSDDKQISEKRMPKIQNQSLQKNVTHFANKKEQLKLLFFLSI